MRKCLAPATFLLGALLLSACEKTSPVSTETDESSVKIVSISPDPGQPLLVGQKVNLEIGVAYALVSDSATLGIVVQAADNRSITQNIEVVTKGSGQSTLRAEFEVPDTKAIQVFIPLTAQGQNSTLTVDSRAFKVLSK